MFIDTNVSSPLSDFDDGTRLANFHTSDCRLHFANLLKFYDDLGVYTDWEQQLKSSVDLCSLLFAPAIICIPYLGSPLKYWSVVVLCSSFFTGRFASEGFARLTARDVSSKPNCCY